MMQIKTEISAGDLELIKSRHYFERTIKRLRKKVVPNCPKTIHDFESSINDSSRKQHFKNDLFNALFFRGVKTDSYGSSNIIFLSQTIVENLIDTDSKIHLFMDGTFRVVPKHFHNDEKLLQLYIIHIVHDDVGYPLMYVLMQSKNFESYDLIFSYLSSFIKADNVELVMSDYEAASRKAVKKNFPTAKIEGCLFHYMAAISKMRRKLELPNKFMDVVKKMQVLPLLPENFIASAFTKIAAEVDKELFLWIRFKKYWIRQWLRANISVFGSSKRTNNVCEQFNRNLNRYVKIAHPNIWQLIHNLQRIDFMNSKEYLLAKQGEIAPRNRKRSSLKLNAKIKTLTNRFKQDHSIMKFINSMVGINDLDLESCSSNEIDDYDECIDYYTVIPNTQDQNHSIDEQTKQSWDVMKASRKSAEIENKENKKPRGRPRTVPRSVKTNTITPKSAITKTTKTA